MSDTVIQPPPLGHPLAGQKMTGAQMIMQVVADEGTTAIFGYSGGAILPTLRRRVPLQRGAGTAPAVSRSRSIVPANEQGAAFMARGLCPFQRSGGGVPRDAPARVRPTRSPRCAIAWRTRCPSL